jgi:hypothetical protein
MKFRDETQQVGRKVREKAAKSRRKQLSTIPAPPAKVESFVGVERDDSTSLVSESTSERGASLPDISGGGEPSTLSQHSNIISVPSSTPRRSLSPNLDDQALGFFFTNHVLSYNHKNANSHIYGMENTVITTGKAVGLAGISNFARTADLKAEARKRYLAAIQAVNNALAQSSTATDDSTLISILLLVQFETIECCLPRSLAAWETHVKGAAAVLKMRGAERLKKPLEIRLFVQATSFLTARCMKVGIAPPEYLFGLAEIASKNVSANEPGWRIFHLQMQFARFRSEISQGVITDLHLILREALRLDGLCSSIPLEGNPVGDFETIPSDHDSDVIMVGYYHVYPNFMAAHIWNAIRTTRLALHEIIRKTLLKGFACHPPVFFDMEHTAQFQISTDTLLQLQRDVLASIPQHLGLTIIDNTKAKEELPLGQNSFAPRFPWSNFQSSVYNPNPTSSPLPNGLPLIRSFGGYVLPWLLYVVGRLSITTPMIQQKILKTLRLIGHLMGIQQAFILADEMESKMVRHD